MSNDANRWGVDWVRVVGAFAMVLAVSSLFQVNWDKVLGTAVTIRNWNTVTKLLDLAG